MSEYSTPVQAVRVNFRCTNCNEGNLLHEPKTPNMAAPVGAPWYDHRCDHCGWPQRLRSMYPAIRFEDIPESHE